MTETTYIEIGYTQKTHGVQGELKLFVEDRYYEDLIKNERIFVEQKGAKVPFFIEDLRGGGALIVKFEGVDKREAAMLLQSKKIYLRPQDLIPEAERELEVEEEENPFAHLKGYHIHDKHSGDIGPINEIIEMPQQALAVLLHKGNEVMIPLHPKLITSTDKKQKILHMDLPEGLLE
jgi:16S rRNA processing protein RimM